jgi:hypothetical protein
MLVWKWDTEGFFRKHDFTKWLTPSGATIASATVKIYDSLSIDQSATMISDIAIIMPELTHVKYKIKGGTAGQRYKLVVSITTVDSQIFVDKIRCKVLA